MSSATHSEADRLAALRRYEVLDTPYEEAFDRVVRLAAALFGTPIADVSLIDERRQWLKARIQDGRLWADQSSGGPREAPRGWSFCAHAIQDSGVTVVPDARADERFRNNPFVTGEPRIRFYAAAPLRTPDGHNVGALCVISPEPRAAFSVEEQQKLQALADIVVSELELRRQRRADAQILNRVLENSSDCITVLGLDSDLQLMNEGERALIEVGDLRAGKGHPWLEFWPGETRARVLEALTAARAGHTGRFEGQFATMGGTPRWWDVVVSPILGEDGQPERILAISRDVTARREAEERLRRSEATLTAVLDALPVGVIIADAQGRIVHDNAANRALWGVPPETVSWEGYDEWAGWWPGTGERIKAHEWAMARALLKGEVIRGELVECQPFDGGERRFYLNNAAPVRDAAGNIIAGVVAELDVTEARRAEERLRELVDTLDLAAVMVRDLDGTVRFWSRGCERLYGWTAAETVGRSAHGLLHTEYPTSAADVEAALLCCGEWHGNLCQVRRDGTALVVATYKVLHRDEWGRAVAVMESLADVTALRETQAELHEANATLEARVAERTAELSQAVDALRAEALERERAEATLRQVQKMEAVGQLTGGLAHDFNNLLTSISGSLERMQARLAQGRTSDVERYVAVAQGAAQRAAALTHRLLAFSRQQTLDPKPTDLNCLVAGMEELIRRTVGPAIAVEVVTADELWTTLVDPHQLENALLNLCINARDAMHDGGRLTIETDNKWLDQRAACERDLLAGQYVTLCVSDTGTGMGPDVVARAFDPFYTTKPLGQGTGLGLSMVYGFARQSGGQARIYSEPGQGAAVCLYLPRHHGIAEEVEARATPAETLTQARQGKTVLVVDDEPTVRMLVTEVLEELGCAAVEVADGSAGLEVLRSGMSLDLLITDVGLPGGMNGRQVADAGRAVRPELPVLFITGYAENAVVGRDRLEPGMTVLTKPFALEVLARHIREIIVKT